jgi:hypothetical protein
MSFQNFTSISTVARKYNLTLIREKLFDLAQIPPIEPDEFLQKILEFELRHQPRPAAEHALCESLIYPLLRDTWMRHPALRIWSHTPLAVDDELSGVPDYLVAPQSAQGLEELGPPLLAVVEAKREDFATGWGQCLAEMVAVQKLNAAGFPSTIYGIVTTGQIWEFGRLEGSHFNAHPFQLSLAQTDLLLGVLDYFFTQCEAQLTQPA